MLSDDELSEPSKCSLVEQRSATETALRKRYMLCSEIHERKTRDDTSWASSEGRVTHSLTDARTPRFYFAMIGSKFR